MRTLPASKGLRSCWIPRGALLINVLIAMLSASAAHAQSLTASVPTALVQLVQQSAPKAIAEAGKVNKGPRDQAKAANDVRSDKTSRSMTDQAPRERSAQLPANGDRTATVP